MIYCFQNLVSDKERKLVLELEVKLISPLEMESSWSPELEVLEPEIMEMGLCCLVKHRCLVNLLLLIMMLNHCLN